jgi:pimeloyl-ACP methyl ester carboxylesterase/DNA-binding CsgD family transcriptional regulator
MADNRAMESRDRGRTGVTPRLGHARAADGVDLAWASVGDGPTLVHLPGAPFSNFEAEWQVPVLHRTFASLARDLRFIQYDARGTGSSQRTVVDVSFEAMLGDLEAVVDAAGIERFALLGFYHSVTLAIAYAARHPERVGHLILFGGSARGWTQMSGAGTQALLSLIDRDWDTFAESAAHAWLGWPAGDEGRLAADWFRTATTPAIARATLEEQATVDVSDDLARVRCPALVLHRRGATVIPLPVSEELAAGLPNSELRIIEGTSASLFFEDPEGVVDDIVGFVTGRRRGRPTRTADPPGASDAGLSPREREVLGRIAAGDSNAEIAGRLGISLNTVERHVANLYRKIDARGRADATAYAIRNGLA